MEYLMNLHQKYVYDLADPRTLHLPFMDFYRPFAMVTFYLLFCWKAEILMKDLPALSIRPIVVAYNLMMTVLSAYMFIESMLIITNAVTDVWCWPVDWGNSHYAIRALNVLWMYYFTKLIELVEVFMFALRKKYRQISFLHVYHHIIMVALMWMVVKYAGGGQSLFFLGYNAMVHTVMYSYYGLSAIGPQMQKYLWWKKYITLIQLSQFVTMCIQTVKGRMQGCNFQPVITYFASFICFSLFFLFTHFYIKTYRSNKKLKLN